MSKHQYSKLGLVACIAVFVAAFQGPAVADMAEASSILADMYVAATEASADLAAAAGDGEKALKKAQDNLNSIKEALTEAEDAFSKLEAADGDDAAAMQALRGAREQMLGKAPASDQGGGTTPTNIYDVPWETDGLRNQRGKQQAIEDESTSHGGSSFAERDTEEDATGI